jgi:hypothetical protein
MDQNYNNATKVWPGAFGAFKPSREVVRKSIGTLIWLAVLDVVINLVLSILLKIVFGNVGGSTIYDVGSIFIGAFFAVTQVYVLLKGVNGNRVELNEAINEAKPFWMRMVMLNLLIVVTVLAGLILLIIPGIYFALRLSLAPYFLVDKNMDVMEAYKASWDATKGNLGKMLGVIGVYILMILPTITIIGVIATVYLTFMYGAVYALLYVNIRDAKLASETKNS